jgi:hypothetical protein
MYSFTGDDPLHQARLDHRRESLLVGNQVLYPCVSPLSHLPVFMALDRPPFSSSIDPSSKPTGRADDNAVPNEPSVEVCLGLQPKKKEHGIDAP